MFPGQEARGSGGLCRCREWPGKMLPPLRARAGCRILVGVKGTCLAKLIELLEVHNMRWLSALAGLSGLLRSIYVPDLIGLAKLSVLSVLLDYVTFASSISPAR